MVKILQKDGRALRLVSKNIPIKDIKSAKVKKIIQDMKDALDGELDGVAIAAPQIGVNLRLFIISERAFKLSGKSDTEDEDMVFINPEIIKKSKETDFMEEGCLSARWYYGLVKRSKRATVEAFNENGQKFRMGRSGLLAQIFQHEIDHLDAVLFTDKAKDLVEIPPQDVPRI